MYDSLGQSMSQKLNFEIFFQHSNWLLLCIQILLHTRKENFHFGTQELFTCRQAKYFRQSILALDIRIKTRTTTRQLRREEIFRTLFILKSIATSQAFSAELGKISNCNYSILTRSSIDYRRKKTELMQRQKNPFIRQN